MSAWHAAQSRRNARTHPFEASAARRLPSAARCLFSATCCLSMQSLTCCWRNSDLTKAPHMKHASLPTAEELFAAALGAAAVCCTKSESSSSPSASELSSASDRHSTSSSGSAGAASPPRPQPRREARVARGAGAGGGGCGARARASSAGRARRKASATACSTGSGRSCITSSTCQPVSAQPVRQTLRAHLAAGWARHLSAPCLPGAEARAAEGVRARRMTQRHAQQATAGAAAQRCV